MKLESQVVSLELSKKLKSLGCKQESLWYWETWVYKDGSHKWNLVLNSNKMTHCSPIIQVSAITVAELFGKLPSAIYFGGFEYRFELLKRGNDPIYYCNYRYYTQLIDDADRNVNALQSKYIVNTLAKLLIWLIENGHIKKENL